MLFTVTLSIFEKSKISCLGFRQLRKMSLLEVSIIISLIITVGHFLVMWGSYFEKRLAMVG